MLARTCIGAKQTLTALAELAELVQWLQARRTWLSISSGLLPPSIVANGHECQSACKVSLAANRCRTSSLSVGEWRPAQRLRPTDRDRALPLHPTAAALVTCRHCAWHEPTRAVGFAGNISSSLSFRVGQFRARMASPTVSEDGGHRRSVGAMQPSVDLRASRAHHPSRRQVMISFRGGSFGNGVRPAGFQRSAATDDKDRAGAARAPLTLLSLLAL